MLDPVPYRLGRRKLPGRHVVRRVERLAPSPGLPWFFYDNVPGKLDGYEAELTASPTENLLINFSLGQNHYENERSESDVDQLRRAVVPVPAGGQLEPRACSTRSASAAAERLTPRVDAFYQSERDTGPANARPGVQDVVANTCPTQCIPSYTTYNVRLTYEPPNGDWRLALAGTNVTDEFYWQQYSAEIAVNAATGAVTSLRRRAARGVASAPRMWALTIEKQF